MPKFLNLGCGSRFCRDRCWTNIDFTSSCPEVMAHDLHQGIPFPNDLFDAVYHSHLLEHFTRKEGARLIQECLRVLKPEGVLRVAVPDLEGICRLYLGALEAVRSGNTASKDKYEWITLEMYDQAVRTRGGGEMVEYLRHSDALDKEFIISRIGSIGREFLEPAEKKEKIFTQAWKRRAGILRRLPEKAYDFLVSMVLNQRQRRALRIGLFRMSGEVHEVMYDTYSLGLLLSDSGFTGVRPCSAKESLIPNWGTTFLDTDPDGFEHAPSSLYMEGMKPR